MVTDQMSFEHEVAQAHARHREAIKSARSAYDAACHTEQAKWRERLASAKAAFDAVKSDPEPGEAFEAIRREFDEARRGVPDIEPARQQLGEDVAEADAALNRALAEARGKLLAA
jgi:hypothetical protein